jgi:hypothetical protein
MSNMIAATGRGREASEEAGEIGAVKIRLLEAQARGNATGHEAAGRLRTPRERA